MSDSPQGLHPSSATQQLSCVTSGMPLTLSGPQFPHLQGSYYYPGLHWTAD
jgi:hypothetical protein